MSQKKLSLIVIFMWSLLKLSYNSMLFTAVKNQNGKVIKIIQDVSKTQCLLRCMKLETFASYTIKSEKKTCECIQKEETSSEKYTILSPVDDFPPQSTVPEYGTGWVVEQGNSYISTSGDSNVMWSVNRNKNVYLHATTQKYIGCCISKLSSGNKIVWGFHADKIYFRRGISSSLPAGTEWVEDIHSRGGSKDISVSSRTNQVWTVSVNNGVYHRLNVALPGMQGLIEGGGWEKVSGKKMISVSVGDAGVWGIDENLNIFYRKGTRGGIRTGTEWISVEGQAKYLSSGHNIVWVINNSSKLFVRLGITEFNPVGTLWRGIDNEYGYSVVSVNSVDGTVWVVRDDGYIFRRKNTRIVTRVTVYN